LQYGISLVRKILIDCEIINILIQGYYGCFVDL